MIHRRGAVVAACVFGRYPVKTMRRGNLEIQRPVVTTMIMMMTMTEERVVEQMRGLLLLACPSGLRSRCRKLREVREAPSPCCSSSLSLPHRGGVRYGTQNEDSKTHNEIRVCVDCPRVSFVRCHCHHPGSGLAGSPLCPESAKSEKQP